MSRNREGLRCPACRAAFRGTRVCSRCGADLGPLMILAALAWRDRQAAREALRRGEWERCRELAAQAQERHATAAGRRLVLLAAAAAGRTGP